MKKFFIDDFKNTATITKKRIYPYYGATKKQDAFVLKIQSFDKMYFHLTVYETEQEAINKLKTFSCGTFKQTNN